MDNIDIQLQAVDGTISTGEMAAQLATTPYTPIYKVYADSKIPVANSTGKFWEMRFKEVRRKYETQGFFDRWEEAIAYYQNDQSGKVGNKRRELSEVSKGRNKEDGFGTENIVFANASALLPSIYAKNPDIEITSVKSENEDRAKLYEELADVLMTRKVDPGVNIKPKIRRATLTAILTNISYVQLSYVKKEDSTEEAFAEIGRLSQRLTEAKDTKEIREIEGELIALEDKVNMLSSGGPKLRTVRPDLVLIDPDSEEPDLSDASFVIVGEYMRTSYIRAVYGEKDEEGNWKSIYAPSHVASAGGAERNHNGHDDEINSFSLLGEGSEFSKFGYKSQEEFNEACRTLVWHVWDKATRRVLMFNDKDWSMPIWVYDDPYKLTRFFNIFPLYFYTDPTDRFGRSEVMYYLDQQDEINMINRERARMRQWVMTKIFVDKNSVKDPSTMQSFLDGSSTDKYVFGLDLPEGKKIGDMLGTIPLPSTQFESMFETRSQLESINRMSSVTPTLQAQQYKTNTTNKAIESYESTTQTRLDEKIDAIEDLLGDIAVSMLEMCVQFMPEATVIDLIGEARLQELGGWEIMSDPQQLHKEYNLRVIGGSTLKPTSKVKKELAMNLGQILGQFAAASPMVVVVMLKMMQRAFEEEVVLTPEEWQTLLTSVSSAASGANQSGPQGAQGEQGQPNQQAGIPPELLQGLEQVSQLFDNLPPEDKQKIGSAVAHGVPLKQIAATLVQKMQGA